MSKIKSEFGPLNNADYLNKVDEFVSDVYEHFDREKSKIKYYQAIGIQYALAITKSKDVRGMILGYETGLGKTFTALGIIDALLNYENVYYISPKTLAANLPKNLEKYIDMGLNITPGDILKSKIKMINMSSTMVKKLGENEYDQLKGGFVTQLKAIGRGFIIVDEAHKLFQMIANGSAIGREFYDIIRASPPETKVLFMTGSILTSDPFECVPAFNMLTISDPKVELFPSNREDFYNMFIDMEDFTMKNAEYFQNRIMGLVSFVKNISSLDGYPEFRETEVIRVDMTPNQYKLYSHYKEIEMKELMNTGAKFFKNTESFGKKNKGASSTFKVYTRQISNFAPPMEYFTEFVKTGEDKDDYIKKNINKIESPKYEALKLILEKHAGDFGLIYSQFTGIGCFKPLKYKLLQDGYEIFTRDSPRNDGIRRFAIIDGDTKLDDVAYYLDVSASEENKNGGIISFMLLSVAGVTGLDFANAKYKVTYEKHFSPSVEDQFNGRVRRYMSLRYHPKEDWFIDRYLLIAVVPNTNKKGKKENEPYVLSTDEEVLRIEERKRKILTEFNNAIEETSIECALFARIGLHNRNCVRCVANGNRLYTNYISKDLRTPNPCVPTEDNNKFKKFTYQDNIYYFDGKKIYDINKSPISILHPLFVELMEVAKKL